MRKQHYILLDAAKMHARIEDAKHFNKRHLCLYKGKAEERLHTVAPWLFTYPRPSVFADWYLANSGQQHWGIILETPKDFKTVYLHLKKFLIVKTEEGKKLYFRFYDPRVLPSFLETSDEAQLRAFFGPIDKYILESAKGEILEYTFIDGQLNKNKSDFFFEDEHIDVSENSENDNNNNNNDDDDDSEYWDDIWGI